MSEGKELYMCGGEGKVGNGNGFLNNILNLPLASPLNAIPAWIRFPHQRRLPLGFPAAVGTEPLAWSGPRPAVPPSRSVSPGIDRSLHCSGLCCLFCCFFSFSNSILTHGCLRAQRSFLFSLVSDEYRVISTISKMQTFGIIAVMHVCTCVWCVVVDRIMVKGEKSALLGMNNNLRGFFLPQG